MGLNTYPYSPFPASTDQLHKGDNEQIQAEIDEINSDIVSLDNQVNGDAVTYPYADVITIEDAIPANLANCNVKIEPVQDLHGYDHPWVGGAGDNKFSGSDNTYTRSDQSETKWLFTNVPLSSEFTGAYYISFDYLLSEVGETGEALFYGYSNGTQITGNICKMDDKTTSTQWKHFSGLMSKSVTFDAIGCYTDDLISIKNIMVSASEPTTFAPYTNICPITGHTEASVEVTDGDETTRTYTIALGDTIYGGTVDFDSGVMTVTHGFAEFDGSVDEDWTYEYHVSVDNFYTSLQDAKPTSSRDDIISNMFTASYSTMWVSSAHNINVKPHIGISNVNDWKAWLSSNHLHVCYELDTPFTVQLTPQQIQLLKGTNTLTASTGDISVTVNGVSGSIGSVQTQANATDEALEELTADIADKLPTAPTTDGAYVLTVTVASGTPTYSWESAE